MFKRDFISLCKITFKFIKNCLYFTGFFFLGQSKIIIFTKIEVTFIDNSNSK